MFDSRNQTLCLLWPVGAVVKLKQNRRSVTVPFEKVLQSRRRLVKTNVGIRLKFSSWIDLALSTNLHGSYFVPSLTIGHIFEYRVLDYIVWITILLR